MANQSSNAGGGSQGNTRVFFGPFTLEPYRRLLHEGTRSVPLGSRAMDILLLLVERSGSLVTQDELVARAWPELVVTEVNLRVHISAIRRALGGAGTRSIVTIPGRGYRFVTPVRSEVATGQAVSPAAAGRLPALPAYGVVGRGELIERIVERVSRQRLVTIIGPGGIGKTTVAAAAAAAAYAETFPDGVRWIDLGVLTRGGSVATAVAQAIELASYTQDPTSGVIAWLRERQMLLVFDCCERVVAAAAALAERILRETTGIHILATSREALRAAGEHVLRLPPLTTPPESATLTAAEACRFSAVQLFVDRAASALGGFVLRDLDVPLVQRICSRLDGIALAIELAAGHLIAFDLRRVASLLDHKFALLPAGRRTSVARHQTMHATLEWSYDMLPAEERQVLLSLAVFESGATAAAIGVLLSDTPPAAGAIVLALARLTDKSFVNAASGPEGLTYRLLDTTRAFALERLTDGSDAAEVRRRHAVHMLATLRQLARPEPDQGSGGWLMMRRRALPDIRAALAWAFATPGQDALALEVAAEAVELFFKLSLADECRRRATEALGRMERADLRDRRSDMRLRAILASASLYSTGPVARLLTLWDSVLSLALELDNAEHEAWALFGLIAVSIHRNEPEQALLYSGRFRALAVGAADENRLLVSDRMEAIALHLRGHHKGARQLLQDVVARYDPAIHGWNNFGFPVNHGLSSQVTLARVLWFAGEPDKAMRLCRSCVSALLRQDGAIALCYALFEVAVPLHCLVGDLDGALREVRRLKDCAERHGLAIFQAGAVLALLAISALLGDEDEGAAWSAADELLACGYEALLPFLCALMAQAALLRRDRTAGLRWIDAPLAKIRDEQGCWVPELLRLKAELTVLDGDATDVVAAGRDLSRAREIAAQQGAPALELRVATSWARLGTGDAATRRHDLEELVGRFSEGFATADLEAARIVLTC